MFHHWILFNLSPFHVCSMLFPACSCQSVSVSQRGKSMLRLHVGKTGGKYEELLEIRWTDTMHWTPLICPWPTYSVAVWVLAYDKLRHNTALSCPVTSYRPHLSPTHSLRSIVNLSHQTGRCECSNGIL